MDRRSPTEVDLCFSLVKPAVHLRHKFVHGLVDQLRFFDDRDDEALFFAGGTAKWSLASNAQTQPAIRLAIEDAKPKADKRTQELITELLTEDPESIKQQMREIVRKQQEVGKWK